MNDDISKDQALVPLIASADLSVWSEDRQNDFVKTFRDRTRAARYILAKTAELIFETAERRKFVSNRHTAKAFGNYPKHPRPYDFLTPEEKIQADRNYRYRADEVGGRAVADLDQIAGERAEEVLRNLPALKDAVQIIDPDTAKKINRLEALKKKGQELAEELDEVTKPILLADLPDTMTLGAFRTMVKDAETKRRSLLDRLNDIGEEGASLEGQVNKRLYGGLPGLTEAVCKVIYEHCERSAALDATGRRVEEQVKFGNNEAALELLRHFEKDEKTVSASVSEMFKSALEKLKLQGSKRKQLPKKEA